MTASVRKTGSRALKPMSREAGLSLIGHAQILRRHGVSTPEASYDRPTGALVTPWIKGRQGRDLLMRREGLEDAVARAARVAARLHRIPVTDLKLPGFDPWRRIKPRLVTLESCVWTNAARDVADRLIATQGEPVVDPVPVHGDFHIGQLVLGNDGVTWMLDLDDLALGSPEADLANFAAHLATSPSTSRENPLPEFELWSSHLVREWSKISDLQYDYDRFVWYGSAAMLRRALKLVEQNRDLELAIHAIGLAQRLAKSS